MDVSNFSIQLDLVASGLIKTIEDQLLQVGMEGMRIRPELYKLNVYGNPSQCSIPYRRADSLIREGFVLQSA